MAQHTGVNRHDNQGVAELCSALSSACRRVIALGFRQRLCVRYGSGIESECHSETWPACVPNRVQYKMGRENRRSV